MTQVDDDEQLDVVCIEGPHGSGKTTLVDQLCKDDSIELLGEDILNVAVAPFGKQSLFS